jgi:hypothetical protein
VPESNMYHAKLIKHKPKCVCTDGNFSLNSWIFRFLKIAYEFNVEYGQRIHGGWYIIKRNFGITTHWWQWYGNGFWIEFEFIKTEYFVFVILRKYSKMLQPSEI